MDNAQDPGGARILGATLTETGGQEQVMLFGWRTAAVEPPHRIALAMDGAVFGLCEAGNAVFHNLPIPDDALPFAYPLPDSFLDGGEHRFAVAYDPDTAAIAPSSVLPLPRRDMPARKPRTVSACAIVKNEARTLVEWYAHHRILGIEHFYIYDNDSTDDTPTVLAALASQGDVTVTLWPSEGLHSPQVQAYNHALAAFAAETEWLFFFDLDEFLVLDRHARIQDFLDWHQGAGAVAVHWALFGSGGLKNWNSQPVIERFIRRAPPDFHVNRHIKTIARTSATLRVGIHHVELRHSPYVNASGRRIETDGFFGVSSFTDDGPARLNHYFCKSREEWEHKRARGKADHSIVSPDRFRGDEEFGAHDRNEEEDIRLLKRLPEVVAEIDRLRTAVPALAPYCPESDRACQ